MKILHLSDIHFGRNYECYDIKDKFDNKEKILDELINCIAKLDNLKPEHIVVTGDIAWNGKKNEFDEAYQWFKRLLDATGLTGKDITICVGNHDVNRAYASLDTDFNDNSIKEIDDIYDYKNVHKMEAPIYEYDNFCERLGVEPFAYPCNDKLEYSYSLGYKDVRFSSGNTIRFVSFNTALLSFMSSSKISSDKMWIGQKQVKSLMKYGIIPNSDVHYTVALFHHAERFLHPNEICEYDDRIATVNLLRENVDLILCGHTETGGLPILYKQVGGGTLLTAGAAYYNDTHPNAFSILCIPDNAKDIVVNPYTYKNGWKENRHSKSNEIIKKINEIPPLGDFKNKCNFVMRSDDKKHIIPIKKASVYSYSKKGTPYIKIDNRKEVLRYLDISIEGTPDGKKTNVSVDLAPKMERNVKAILAREEYFDFISKNVTSEHNNEFYVETEDGQKIIQSGTISIDKDITGEGIEILKKIDKIQGFYDILFYRPDEIYERDETQIDLIIQLIENGYIDKLPVKLNTASISNLDELKQLYKQAEEKNSFYLTYEKEFYCNLFGVKFSLGNVCIITGELSVDLSDLKNKIETFAEGDSRRIIFNESPDYNTFLIVDKEKAKEKVVIKKDSFIYSVKPWNLNWGFIFEESDK